MGALGSWLRRSVCYVLILIIVAHIAGCTDADPQPNRSPIPPASSAASPVATPAPTPSQVEPELRQAEHAVVRFWEVIDNLSTDPKTDLTRLTTVARGRVAAQWARNINQDRYDGLRSTGEVVVRDALAKRSKNTNRYLVTACIDVGKVKVVDKDGESVVPSDRPPRVSYDYTVLRDGKRWFVIKEKATGTC